jgi:hypothetical protein
MKSSLLMRRLGLSAGPEMMNAGIVALLEYYYTLRDTGFSIGRLFFLGSSEGYLVVAKEGICDIGGLRNTL